MTATTATRTKTATISENQMNKWIGNACRWSKSLNDRSTETIADRSSKLLFLFICFIDCSRVCFPMKLLSIDQLCHSCYGIGTKYCYYCYFLFVLVSFLVMELILMMPLKSESNFHFYVSRIFLEMFPLSLSLTF